jgi:hypothetical protein
MGVKEAQPDDHVIYLKDKKTKMQRENASGSDEVALTSPNAGLSVTSSPSDREGRKNNGEIQRSDANY